MIVADHSKARDVMIEFEARGIPRDPTQIDEARRIAFDLLVQNGTPYEATNEVFAIHRHGFASAISEWWCTCGDLLPTTTGVKRSVGDV